MIFLQIRIYLIHYSDKRRLKIHGTHNKRLLEFTYGDIDQESLRHPEHAERLVLLLHPANGDLDGGARRYVAHVNLLRLLVVDVNVHRFCQLIEVLCRGWIGLEKVVQ